ncbi:VPLPA-CTERM sorting domain-containing protein [Crocinitomicaceae bacterium]|nr:VPLPA-CTERM sorting domain-containing protein [Crocinitomicaceae bacterium]
MNNKTLACAITGAALVLSMSSAFADTIYDESASGDLDAIGTTNVNLVAGINEILGSIPETPPADTDRIKFTQVANLIVDSITLSFTSSFDPLRLGTQFYLDLHNDQANLFDDNFLIASTGAPILASFFDSFGPETGPLTQTTFGTIWDFQISPGTVYPYQDWKLTINTSGEVAPPVPLPAAVWLFGSGLLGLIGIARRKKTT